MFSVRNGWLMTRGVQPRVPPNCVLVVTRRYYQRYYQ